MTKQRIYRAIANRGREYAVVFGHDGNAYSVTSMGNHHMLWSAASGKPMGLAAACAVRAAIVASVDPTSDKNVAYQAANKVVEAITGAPAGSTSVGSWLYDVKARLFPSEADRQVAEMLRATTPVVDRTILDAKDAWVKAGLHGPSKLTTPAKWSRSEWIALGGLALGLATHVANRKRHRG